MTRSSLGEFEHQILLAILRKGGESYSVGIVREIEDITGRDAATSAVYIALRRMEKKGLLESRLEPPDGPDRAHPRRYFALTEAAMEPLREARRSLVRLWDGVEPLLDDS